MKNLRLYLIQNERTNFYERIIKLLRFLHYPNFFGYYIIIVPNLKARWERRTILTCLKYRNRTDPTYRKASLWKLLSSESAKTIIELKFYFYIFLYSNSLVLKLERFFIKSNFLSQSFLSYNDKIILEYIIWIGGKIIQIGCHILHRCCL